jgi:hypothetical protein
VAAAASSASSAEHMLAFACALCCITAIRFQCNVTTVNRETAAHVSRVILAAVLYDYVCKLESSAKTSTCSDKHTSIQCQT